MNTLELDGGRRLAYSDDGQGQPLVFVHGVGTPGGVWRGDLAGLEDACRLIVYERRGYGTSSASPVDWKAHGDDLIDLIERLDAAPAVVVGFSGGAIPALDLALRRPELLAALVLLDPAFKVMRSATPRFLFEFGRAQLLRRVRGPRRGAEKWLRYVAGYSTGGSGFDKASPERRETLLANAEAMFDDFGSGLGNHVDEARLREVSVPVTLIDAPLSPPFLRRSADRLAALMPQARRVTLDGCGHHIALDARDQLHATLRAALAEAPVAAPR